MPAQRLLVFAVAARMNSLRYLLPRLEMRPRMDRSRAGSGTVYRRAVDVLRTATDPLTAREIAEHMLAAANVANPDREALGDLTGSVLASLRNHIGKGIERTNEGAPARWRLKEAAS